MMTEEHAIQLLLMHSCSSTCMDKEKAARGFCGMLKNYQGGELDENNFHQVMQALRCVAGTIQQENIQRAIAGAPILICYRAWIWGLKTNDRNGTSLPEDQIARLHQWVSCIYWTATLLLEGAEIDEAFGEYEEYLEKRQVSSGAVPVPHIMKIASPLYPQR